MIVAVGDRIPEWVMERVQIERMRTMAAILRDPNPVHWDRNSTARYGLAGRTINQGPLGLSYMINMLHEWAGPGCIKRLFMTFPLPVLDDDRIVAQGEVTAIRSEGGERLVDCNIWLARAGSANPLEGSALVRLPS